MEGIFSKEECLRKKSVSMKAAWRRGVYSSEEYRRKLSVTTKAAWRRGDIGDEEWRRKLSAATKATWKRGGFDGRATEETRRKLSKGAKAAWARGDMDGVHNEEYRRKQSVVMKTRWARGDFDGVFQSPTSIELQIAAALDIMGIEHQPQYRPDGYSCTYDEFVPPNTLIEVQGDYWHGPKQPGQQKRDAEKAQWAKENGFELIAIWEYEIKERGAWAIIAQMFAG